MPGEKVTIYMPCVKCGEVHKACCSFLCQQCQQFQFFVGVGCCDHKEDGNRYICPECSSKN